MPAETINRKINSWRAAWFCLRSAGVLLDCLAAALWLAAATAGAVLLFGMTREQRLLFTAFAAAWLLWRLGAGFAAFLPDLRLKRFGALAEAALPELKGRLLSALDLSLGVLNAGASPAFARRHLEDAAALLKSARRPAFISFKKTLPPARLAGLVSGLCAAAVIAWSAPSAFYWFLHPLALRPLEDVMEIKPGNAGIMRGRPFRIEAIFKNGGEGAPALFLRGRGAAWTRGFAAAAGPGRFIYAGASLESDLLYRLKYGELQSSVYRLTAVEPPALKDILFSVIPPAYTGEPALSCPYLPSESEVLAGSLVTVSGAAAGKPFSAALLFAAGGELPLRAAAGGRMKAEFTVTGDASYRLSLKTADGENVTDDPHSIRVLADEAPAVEILSPAFGDLESAPEEEVAAVYEASDDIGLREIRLRRKVWAGGRPVPDLSYDKSVKIFTELSARRFSGEAALELYDLPDGAEAEFQFSACDRSPAAVCARSGTVKITVTDFSARHASAYTGLGALKKEVGALKERENAILSDLSAGETAIAVSTRGSIPWKGGLPRIFTAEEMAAYEHAWRETADAALKLGNELEKDPYMGSSTLARYELFRDDMVYGAGTAREKAVPETLSGRTAQAAKTHETLRNSLEAGERSLEAALRFEDARSSAFGFEGMARSASDMAGEISSFANASRDASDGTPGSEGDWRKLERTLEKISAELSRIQALLKDRPPRNSDGKTFALPAGGALETAGELAAAIKGRDAGKAAALAAKLSEKLSQMRRVMEEYASYQASADDGRGEEEKASELSARWKTLYDAQSAETSAGRELAEALLVKTDKARTALLSELPAATAAMAKSLAALGADAPGVNAEASRAYPAVLRAQENIKIKDLAAARAALEDALAELGKSTCAACAPALREAESGIRGGLDRIVRLGSDPALLEPADLALFPPAAERQERIRQESAALAALIAGNYSGAMAGRLTEKLDAAGEHMAKAAAAFYAKDIRPAGEEQLKALDELELGSQALDDMLDKMKAAAAGSGSYSKPAGIFTRPASGLSAEPVKLPKAGDYTPPADLRKKVMESLNERYPASQKELIEDYLKNVAK
jgi:hypothetical protein